MKGKSAELENNLSNMNLQKTPNLKNVKSNCIDTHGWNNLFEVGKAGEYVRATFKGKGHAQQPSEVRKTRGHTKKNNDN